MPMSLFATGRRREAGARALKPGPRGWELLRGNLELGMAHQGLYAFAGFCLVREVVAEPHPVVPKPYYGGPTPKPTPRARHRTHAGAIASSVTNFNSSAICSPPRTVWMTYSHV